MYPNVGATDRYLCACHREGSGGDGLKIQLKEVGIGVEATRLTSDQSGAETIAPGAVAKVGPGNPVLLFAVTTSHFQKKRFYEHRRDWRCRVYRR